MTWVINECFNDSTRKFIKIGNNFASWTKSKTHKKFKNQKNTNSVFWNKYQLISHIRWLIDNIYVVCGKSLFKQKIGIPMGTDCAPFLANIIG